MFIFDLHVGDRAVSTPKTASTANKTRLERCFHNSFYESLDHCLRFLISWLMSAESSCFKVGTRDLVFSKSWLNGTRSA